MTLPIAAGSCPSSPSSSYSNPPVVDSPMIGGRLNGMTVAVRICCASANTPADQRLRRIRRRRAVRERLQRGDHEGGVRLADAVEDREADDREDVLDLRHLPQQFLDCAAPPRWCG